MEVPVRVDNDLSPLDEELLNALIESADYGKRAPEAREGSAKDFTLAPPEDIVESFRATWDRLVAELDLALGSDAALLFINRKKYDSLPPQAKAAFEKHSGESVSRALGQSNDREAKRGWDFLAEQIKAGKNAPIKPLPPAEVARWQKTIQPIIDGWVGSTPNGKAVYQGYLAEVKKASTGK